MSDDFSSILESDKIHKSHLDKRVSYKLIQMILGGSVIYLALNDLNLVDQYATSLPQTYPLPSNIFKFRHQFIMGFAIVCIVYAALLSCFFLVLNSSDKETSEEDDTLDVDLRRRRFLRTNKLITKASVVADILLMILWASASSGFLFPISNNDVILDVKSISCQAAHDSQIANQAPWREICNGSQSLILLGYTLCGSFLFSSVYSLMYLSKNGN